MKPAKAQRLTARLARRAARAASKNEARRILATNGKTPLSVTVEVVADLVKDVLP